MVDGVTMGLQKEVRQLQKDYARLEYKFDGAVEQIKVDFYVEFQKCMGSLQAEMEKNI